MTNAGDQPEVDKYHRTFAATCNNLAWTLSSKKRTRAEDAEMLNAAHASAYHWHLIGDDINRMRATMLLAEVHAALGMGPTALAYANEMRDYFLGHETPDWELAFTHAVHAHAAHAAGEKQAYAESYQKAKKAIDAISDPNDREIVEETFRQIPSS
ncbi:hypothetical protein Pan216_32010 [Planctomycetes bacterium Pan216]|uniref:Uncharacterized protein n=1 Tax=Kolteria novifilia TaxID=2527975 RepID=A0A518B5T8_9BACT|nr:hypothetical protein Pan216_32010 [Planctomycetes bacterium Pan216]